MKRLLPIVLFISVGFSQQIIHTETYDNGNVKSITYHKKTRDGIEKVKYERYDQNGQKWSKGTYKDGELISEKCWDEDGNELMCWEVKLILYYKKLQLLEINDFTREPIIAPFTFPILKTEDRLKIDLEEQKKSVPFLFNREDEIVKKQTKALAEFFAMVNELRHRHWRFEESKRLVYERKYHKQYEKARSEFVSDSTNLSILTSEFDRLFPFTKEKPAWLSYIKTEHNPKYVKDLEENQLKILQICRNRWTEGIYDIAVEDILSNEVTVNQNDLPDLASPDSFNDLQAAWTRARKELLSLFPEGDAFRDLGYNLIVEFMKPNLLFDQEKTTLRQNETLNRVSRLTGVVLENELIVDANMRITEDVLQKLNSLAKQIKEKIQRTGFQ